MEWLAIAALILAAGGAAYQGEQTAKAGRRSERVQKQAQRQALLGSIDQEKRAAIEERKANQRTPDVTRILFQEQAAANTGVGSTILTKGKDKGGMLGFKSTLMG